MSTKRRQRHSPEQNVLKLRDREPLRNAGKGLTALCQSLEISEATWNRWRNRYGGMKSEVAKRPIAQMTYTGGSLGETRHLYYSEPSKWQVLEERVIAPGESPGAVDGKPAERQFVWGLRYIDDLIVRDRDTDDNGTLDERLYACQDANWNVTAVVNATGTVQERYAYTAYGQPTFLTATFGGRTTSSYTWESLYCGYRYEAATGLFHVRHRVLHTTTGTWVQRDPLGYVGVFSLYSYCRLRPHTATDPSGLRDWMLLVQKPPRLTVGKSLLKALLSACDSCNCDEQQECRQDAKTFAASVQSTVNRNYWIWWQTLVGDDGDNDTVGGYLCYEWAFAYEDVFSASIADSRYFNVTVEEAIHNDDWNSTRPRVHYWLRIRTNCGSTKEVYLDDGFGPSGKWVNESRPIPSNYGLSSENAVRPGDCMNLVIIAR